VLSGHETNDAIALIDPSNGENLLAHNGRRQRGRLIDAARLSRDRLIEAESEMTHGRGGTAARILERLFIGNL